MTTGIGLVAFATTPPAVFLLLACFYLGIVIAEPARGNPDDQAGCSPGGGSMGFQPTGVGARGHDGLRGGGALHDYAMARATWLPWLVLGTVGVTTLLLLANCFQRGSRLAGVSA